MPGMRIRRVPGNLYPRYEAYDLANSLTVHAGDLAVLTTSGGTPVLRQLSAADITAVYADASGDPVGILGVFEESFTTSGSGVINGAPDLVTRAGGVASRHRIVSMGDSLPASTGGRSRSVLPVFDTQTVVGGDLLETTTITEDLIGTAVGISLSGGVYKFSTAAAIKVGKIVGVHTGDANFNVSGGGGEVFVQFVPLYLQSHNNANYAT